MAYIPNRAPVGAWTRILASYRQHSGSVAYIFHRISGVALTSYLFIHIWALSSLKHGRAAFQAEMDLFTTFPFKVLEWVLAFAVMFHALNGARIALVDLAQGAKYHKALLTAVYIVSFILVVLMGVLIFQEELGIHVG
ncbi:MAG TPA: succinate dehydrogenase, cytochrome b556 subunit [Candidatus Kapabacteria bacterium]|nr:succinate dehydrogenase, cytochrome b556 subunit [Candidatus Kapabacteria bacterium]